MLNPDLSLEDQISSLKGIGDSISQKLAKLNIFYIKDLVRNLPNRYIDFSKQVFISELKDKKTVSFYAEIGSIKSFYTKSGKQITQAIAKDKTGQVTLSWFNNPYIKRMIVENEWYTVAGQVTFFAGKLTIISPTVEQGNSFSLNTKGLVPIYSLTKGITSRWLRQKVYSTLNDIKIEDPLSSELLLQQNLISVSDSYNKIHFPADKKQKLLADKRLSFNQHLSINISNLLRIRNLGNSPKIKINSKIHLSGLNKFNFVLTEDQQKAIKHLYKDISSENYSHRLIQGDTGSGKTATIIMAANQCLSQNQSCALIAPTQILATQHWQTFQKYFLYPDNLHLVVGGDTKEVPTNKPFLYIGTHALITKLPPDLKYPLNFLAIDEQHKFGVNQREKLQDRRPIPHLVNLSATPIPRTVALGLLGDINLSNIHYKPQNRLPVKTYVMSTSYFQKSTTWLIAQLKADNQIYIVCPNIHDKDTETASVEKIAKHYKNILPSHISIFSLHGQQKSQDQKNTIDQFKSTNGSVLVSTSLIEVGIDIPSATIMIIHSAERFGLAQLHQLRGRVGRGEKQSYCFLIPTTDDQVEKERLQLLQKYNHGLTLAKKDLILRGAGEVFGEKQHGSLQTKLTYFWSKKSFLNAKKVAKSLIGQDPDASASLATSLNNC